MRESRILKAICYITLPIFIGCLVLSILYGLEKKNYENKQINDISYFNTDAFLNEYMTVLSRETENLIYRNDKYKHIQDGDYTIYYKNTYGSGDYGNSLETYGNLKGFYYLIIYKQKVFTNIELTTKTNTLEKLKQTVAKKDAKSKVVNIINGNIESESEIISTKAIQFFDNFKNTYYTKTEIVSTDVVQEKVQDNNENANTNSELSKEEYIYITTEIQDFQIYSLYKEEVIAETSNVKLFVINLLQSLEKYENVMSYTIPVCSTFIMVILLYLMISIGHAKGKQGIDLNDFDKLFFEIILIVAIITVIIAILIFNYLIKKDIGYQFIYSCIFTEYLVLYTILTATCVTFIKRIKAKKFLRYSILGKVLRYINIFLKKIYLKMTKVLKNLSESWSLSKKTIVFMVLYIFVVTLIIIVFKEFGVLIDVIISCFVFYKVIERVSCIQKIEKHLKKMYEGTYSDKLEERDFTKEFKSWTKYINDISNGFEKSIKERIKSERLKTELITNVSHDIKTPLTSIINYVDLLKKEDIKSEKAKEYIEVLENKSQRLKKLTEDLVEASKASSGSIKLDMQKIRLTELIKQSIGEFEDKFNEKKLDIVTNYPKQDVSILADNKCLYRVIENLFVNISKYALENSRVYIEVKKEEKKAIITLKNISKDRLNISTEELMQRFVRGDKSRTTEGSGLGLSISKSLTELQKGKFDIQIDGDLFKTKIEFDIV